MFYDKNKIFFMKYLYKLINTCIIYSCYGCTKLIRGGMSYEEEYLPHQKYQ